MKRMAEEGPPPPKRVKLSKVDLEALSKEELIEKWQEREDLIESLSTKQSNSVSEPGEGQEKAKQKEIDHTRRENILMMRLTTKEQEVQDYMNQVGELKQAQNTSTAQLRSMLLDPAINLMFQRMKKEMDACKEKLEQAQNDLAAWKFTPDSQTGKRLMAKCRMLLQENEELGKIISSGRTAKLEGEIALEKTLVAEMKKSQGEMDEFLIELEEDVEGMQSTIYFLQQQLKESKEQNTRLQQENETLRVAAPPAVPTEPCLADSGGPMEQDNTRTTSSEQGAALTGAQTGLGDARTTKSCSPARSSPTRSSPTRSSPSPTQSPSPGSRQPVSKNNLVKQHSPPPPATASALQTSTLAPSGGEGVNCHLTKSQSQTSNGGGPRDADSSNNNTETELSDEGPTEESGPDNSQTHHYPTRGREQKSTPPARAGTKYPDLGVGDNTDATSSEGWSPSASKHSGSLGAADDDVSSSVSEADPSTDAKSGETVPNGVAVSPQYDSQGEEEDMET